LQVNAIRPSGAGRWVCSRREPSFLDVPADGVQLLAEGDAVAVARDQELGEPSLSRSFARSA
jgi:hypothetical protein